MKCRQFASNFNELYGISGLRQLPARSILVTARRLWRIGNALLEVRLDELWRHRDCASFNDWLRGYSVLSRPTPYLGHAGR